jgi:hypothetical protein
MHDAIAPAQIIEQLLSNDWVTTAQSIDTLDPAVEFAIEFRTRSGEAATLFTTAAGRALEKPLVLTPQHPLPGAKDGTNYLMGNVPDAIKMLDIHYKRVRGEIVVSPDGTVTIPPQ